MSENNYECPKCHNVFPIGNKMLHDARCTESKPLPLNQSRLVGPNANKKENENRQPMQHRPQPKITAKRGPESHINPLSVKESVMQVPESFNCWLCGQTLPEKERDDHMLCHQMEEENENYRKKQKEEKSKNPQPFKPPQRQPQKPNQQQKPAQRPPQQQKQPFRPQQQKPPQRPPQQQKKSPQKKPPQKKTNNKNINIKKSYVPFDDIHIFNFGQINENLNKIDNPTEDEILNILPETDIGDVSKLAPEKRNCILCLIDLKTGDKATVLPCVHMFHTACIQGWLKSKNICPICQLKLTKENLHI